MDKFTVDLDQVLNDFEYSELTTEQQEAPAPPFRAPHRTYSATKHSINNVFSSLNEYLSTEINENCIDYNTLESTSSQTATGCATQEIALGGSAGRPAVTQMTPVKEKPLESLIAEPILLKIEVSDESFDADKICEQLEVFDTDNKLIDLEIDAKEEDKAVLELEIAEIKDLDEKHEVQQEVVEEIVEETDVLVTEEKEGEEESQIIAQDEVLSDSMKDDARDVEVVEAVEMVERRDADSTTETEATIATTETRCDRVGFHLEVADEDAARYLADLEDADDEESFHDVPSGVTPDDAKEIAPGALAPPSEAAGQEEQTESTAETQRPNSLDIKDVQEEVNLIGNPGSTPYNNVYVSKEVPVEERADAQYESASSASVSPTFSEASTDSVRSAEFPEKKPSEDAPLEETVGEVPSNSEEENVDSDSINPNADAEDESWLGKRAPRWTPDTDALNCQHCETRFTVIKRRHHCRACGLVLCAKCCGLRLRLAYMSAEARVCTRCHEALSRETDSGSGGGDSPRSTPRRDADAAGPPNPNNPMEYCSVVPPHQQARAGASAPSVMVPVGVLKRQGSSKKHNKSVMFCDGIRPGSDLAQLDLDFDYAEGGRGAAQQPGQSRRPAAKASGNLPPVDPVTRSFIPERESCLPPTVNAYKSEIAYTECANNASVVEMLENETLTFAVQRNLHIHVRLALLDCCVNKRAWCFSTEGLIAVGQDEIVILLEHVEGETSVPKDVFHHLNNVYNSAVKGTTVTELGLSIHPTASFLDSRNHAGFIFVRPTFQCLQKVIVPKEPYLVGVLVHRWETPWARIFPLRLVLRLGAEYRYYPTPLLSTRHRDSVFVEIGHTIINLLADFRNFSYTLPNIRGLTIHMEEKRTTVSIPVNRYDQVMKSMSNSSEHILAFGGNFSADADSHLVCIQDTRGSDESSYKTHAINIQSKPRRVTGASFIVFNGALKSSSGLTAKSSIVEDGLMVQIPPEHMVKVRDSLRRMQDHSIRCGCVNAAADETVSIVWTAADANFNVGVTSAVDGRPLGGVPSIRVHNGRDYACHSGARLVRWTEVFLLQSGEESARTQDPVDISKVAESISKATCQALVKYLDLLATNSFVKIGIRTTLHVDDVSYAAGANGQRLPPIYMKSLDNELVPVLHRITSAGSVGDGTVVLELIFRILNV